MPITVTVENAQANLYQYLNELDAATLDKVIATDGVGGAELFQIVTQAVYEAADPGGSVGIEEDVVAAYSGSPATYAAPLYKMIKNMRDRQAAAEAQKASGTITAVIQANIIDGELVTLPDAGGTDVIFEFDQTGTNTPAPGNIEVDVSGDTTANDVAVTLASVINAQPEFTAPAPGAAVVAVSQADPGTGGNGTITEGVADAGFLVSGFAGGTDVGVSGGVIGLKNSKNDANIRSVLVPADHAAAIGL